MTVSKLTGLRIRNGERGAVSSIPLFTQTEFSELLKLSLEEGARLSAMFVFQDDVQKKLAAVLAHDAIGKLEIFCCVVTDQFVSMTSECVQTALFEREIYENHGVLPVGHPWLKPVREGSASTYSFYEMGGHEIHEVAVGPVHAGIIEPGHFRFQCHGEHVYHLEIMLGYQHRGIEKKLLLEPALQTLSLAGIIAGDTTVGHSLAYCQNIEKLSVTHVPAKAYALRAIALELERIANHVGDLGALAGDVGYLPVAAFCGRIRGDFLNMTALICGNRFGRGFLKFGGVDYDLDLQTAQKLQKQLAQGLCDIENAIQLLLKKRSVLSRFEDTGVVSLADANRLGLVGVAARASGLESDVRHNYPVGIYRFFQVPISTYDTGDVFARAFVRWLEIQRSISFIKEQISFLPPGPKDTQIEPLCSSSFVVSLVEGWRGEICHVAMTCPHGKLLAYKVVDPSFHNWSGLELAMRNQQISDFPLCNKSFNLSYCGFDL